MAWELRMEGTTFSCLADPTGELNEIVWSSLGHMRGTVGYNTVEANTTEGASAVRWPQISPIDINRPKDLKLNEWYWPSLHQHPSEVWIAVAGGDNVLTQASAAMSKAVTLAGVNAIVMGAWKISTIDKDFPDPGSGESSPFKEIVVMCLSDRRVTYQYRINNTYASNHGSTWSNSVLMTGDLAGRIGRYPQADITLETQDIVPCPRCVYEQEPIFGVWLDSVIMGLGWWPVFRMVSSPQAGAITSHSASADNDLARTGTHVTPAIGMPTTGTLTEQKNKLDNDYVFPGQIVDVNYILRYDKFALGDKPYGFASKQINGGSSTTNSRPRISVAAVTAFFENVDANGYPTGSTGDIENRLKQWMKDINSFRLAASRRPGRTVYYEGLPPDDQSIPPSAWIISPVSADANSNNYVIKELAWPVDCFPHDFPVTWSQSFGGIPWVDSAKIGQVFTLYAKTDGSWYTQGFESTDATERARVIWNTDSILISEGGWDVRVFKVCEESPDYDLATFCHRGVLPVEQLDPGTPDYLNFCDHISWEAWTYWWTRYLTCYGWAWNWYWWSTWPIECEGERCYWLGPPDWHWLGGTLGVTYCWNDIVIEEFPCIAKVMRTAANVKTFSPSLCWAFMQGVKNVYIDESLLPPFPPGVDAPIFPPLNPSI